MGVILNDHVGEQLVALVLMEDGFNADVEAAMGPGTDADKIAAALQLDLETVFRKHLGSDYAYSHRKLLVKVHPRSGVIKSPQERSKELFEALAEIGEAQRDGEDELAERNLRNPDNGKFGWWRVSGVRHHCLVQTDSAPEAIKIAEEKELVGNWEAPEATFWVTNLPQAFR